MEKWLSFCTGFHMVVCILNSAVGGDELVRVFEDWCGWIGLDVKV
jgi:hypothetical protein